MKYIVRIVVSAFALISAAACYNNEIDNPDNPQNPEQSGLRITATMAKTRVSFGNEDSNNIYPEWEEGDILFGFYVDGDGDGDIQNFILTVTGVDTIDDNSTATLGIVEGNNLAKQADGTEVYLIYTGINKEDIEDSSEYDALKFTNGEFPVNLAMQNRDRIPVCMSATATIGETDGAKTLSFNFAYDCAVLEIQSLRGFKEDKSATSISKIEVTDLVLGGTYKYDSLDGFRFEPNTSTATYSVSVDPDKWDVNADGKLVYEGNPKGFLIAAAPNSTSKEIKVKVYNSASSETPYFVHPCNSTTISAGRCYVVRSEEVVAKTIDGLYFTTVKAAFDHAEYLNDNILLGDKPNIVTLVKSEINGLGNNSYNSVTSKYVDLIINIDYPVTLDLNNCDLQLCIDPDTKDGEPYENNNKSGGFYVAAGVNFTITDGSEEGEGYITSNCECPIIDNLGLMTVNYGCLYNYVGNVADNGGTLTVCGGELYSSDNVAIDNSINGTVVIEDGEVDSKNGYAIKSLGGILTITGGSIYSTNQSAIICDGGSIDIDGKDLEIYTNATTDIMGYNIPAIIIKTEDQKNASFDMDSGHIYSSNGAIVFDGNVRADISGGLIESNVGTTVEVKNGREGYFETAEGTKVPNCTISGGTIARKLSNQTGYSLNILYGSSCKISGGIIYNLCTSGTRGGAISCYTNTKGDGTSLTVEWPKYDSGDDNTSLGEPLIYSSGADIDATPIEANKISNDIDYALIYLNGGYLYHNRTNNTCFFSCDSINDEYSSNIASFGEVYSNTNYCRYSGSRSMIPTMLDSIRLNDKSIRSLSSQTLSGDAIVKISNSSLGDLQFIYHIY